MVASDPGSRQPSPWMLLLVVVISLAITSVHAREGDGGPVHVARRAVMAVAGPIAYAGDVLTLPFRAAAGWMSGFTVSREEVAELRDQNAQLRRRNAELEEAALENERLRKLVGFVEARDLDAKGAHVIGMPSSSWDGVVVLDVGAEDGIRTGMPVLAEEGLVGQVVEVAPGSSRVRLLTDQRSGAAAYIQRTRGTGVVRGSVHGALGLEFVEREAVPKVGDVVLTSGLGGVYPRGLVIGSVSSVDLRPNDLFPRVVVESRVRFSTLEEVLVLMSQIPQVEGAVE